VEILERNPYGITGLYIQRVKKVCCIPDERWTFLAIEKVNKSRHLAAAVDLRIIWL